MYRIILVLLIVAILGFLALQVIQRGPSLFIKPPDVERIAFLSDRGGHPDIWVMKADGTSLTQVTNDSAVERAPAWSPDAREIAFVSDRYEGTYQLFVAGWDGRYSNHLTISEGIKDMPAWTDDGREIVFISSGKVYGIKRRGGAAEQYLPPRNMPEDAKIVLGLNNPFKYAAWSRGKKALLFVQEVDLGSIVGVIDSEQFMKLQETGPEDNWQSVWDPVGIMLARNTDVAWSPSGDMVAVGFVNRQGENGLAIADAEYGNTKDLFVSRDRAAARPCWSPDGKKIAFEMWSVNDGFLDKCVGTYMIPASGGKPKLVLGGDAREPSWSPDGNRIVCSVTRKDGGRDIWLLDTNGGDPANLTRGKGDNTNPVWSPRPRD